MHREPDAWSWRYVCSSLFLQFFAFKTCTGSKQLLVFQETTHVIGDGHALGDKQNQSYHLQETLSMDQS